MNKLDNGGVMVKEEQKYAYWLFRVKGIGNRKKIRLIGEIGSPRILYETTENFGKEYLTKKQIEQIQFAKEDINLEDWKSVPKEIMFVSYGEEEYPRRLKELEDAPYGLLYYGRLPHEYKVTVAMIGARKCSQYGAYIAEEFAKYLGAKDIQVISGMARGIDGISQRYTLEAGGYSCGVLGSGVDICYPPEEVELYENLKEKGGLVSEFPLGTSPKAQLFPARNRIISGLSDFVLVIEAKQKSGTLITVDMALEQGKDVYAIPGKILDALSYGCNYLIKQGAGIILSPKDLYSEIAQKINCNLKEYKKEEEFIKASICSLQTPLEQKIYELLDFNPCSVDSIYTQISKEDKITISQVMCGLVKLVMSGDAVQLNGNYFYKKYKS